VSRSLRASPVTVAEILGHEDATVTLRVYAHRYDRQRTDEGSGLRSHSQPDYLGHPPRMALAAIKAGVRGDRAEHTRRTFRSNLRGDTGRERGADA
jgi:hypothetical protein